MGREPRRVRATATVTSVEPPAEGASRQSHGRAPVIHLPWEKGYFRGLEGKIEGNSGEVPGGLGRPGNSLRLCFLRTCK